MSYAEEYRNELEQAHRQQTATKLFDGIRKLYGSESSPRRWIWELLQNAKDVAKDSVKIEIIFNKEYLKFKHNGRPFLMKNITYLIEQVSTKDRNSNKKISDNGSKDIRKTGKFGTGFMTTHLLSKKVELRSIFEDPRNKIYKRFQLCLDRSATTVEEMIEAVKEASNIRSHLDDETLCPTELNYKPYLACDTSFRYQLDENGLDVAKKGINDLYNAIIYTLVFIEEIESVLVKNQINSSKIFYQVKTRETKENITISHIEKRTGKQAEQIFIASCSKTISLADEEGQVSIAIQLEHTNNQYSVVKLAPSIPLLFCDFPLIGSETKFKCPVVINSPLLEPTEPRDSVLLDDRNETGGKKNRIIFEEVVQLYKILLDYAASNWLNAHLLAKSGLPLQGEQNWYESNIQSLIRGKILTTPLVVTCDCNKNIQINLQNALIPYCARNILNFWELAILLHPDKLPQKQDVSDWYEIINADTGWAKELRYDLSRLLKDIHEQKNLDNLSARIGRNQDETKKWLNKVIAFVFDAKQVELLNSKYAILPNQYGKFKLKAKVVKDENIPEGLKDVLAILDEDWREELLHLDITCNLEQVRNIRNISERISAIISEQEHPNLRNAVYLLISYIPNALNTKSRNKENQLTYRTQVWEFACTLDNNVPPTKNINNWVPYLWDICDDWLFNTLIQDIAQLENVEKLQVHCGKATELETVDWLSSFINFLKANKKESLYSEQPIFPNQQGNLKIKNELSFDKNIPEQLKDVLELLETPCRHELLHRNILGFDNSLKQFNVADVSSLINEIIREFDDNQSGDIEFAIYALISYFKVNTKEENRLQIWQFASSIYGDCIPQKTFLKNLEDFSWKESNKWILKRIVEQIAETENLHNLIELLCLNREDAITWLNRFLYFISKYDDKLLDDYPIMPTQNEDFKLRKELQRDGGIPEELKEIARCLKLQEWNDFLLLNDTKFLEAQKLIDESNTAKVEDIAIEIDLAIKKYDGDRRDNKFRVIAQKLFHWTSSISELQFKTLFTYFYEHKAEILLETIGDDRVRNNIFDMLQVEPPKLDALADLARNPNVTVEDLHQLSENLDVYKTLETLKQKLEVQEEEVIAFLAELGINFSPSTIQESNSTNWLDIPSRLQSEQPALVLIEQDSDGSSYAESAERIGQIGEHWAGRLYREFLEFRTLPPDDSGFDLLFATEDSELLRVEVKAITFNRPLIRITENEWSKMVEYEDSYELIICSHDKGTPQEFIRVKRVWSTLINILACLQNQANSYALYMSSKIESVIGLQLKNGEQGNDILINWHRLFKQCQHPNIIRYHYNDISGFKLI